MGSNRDAPHEASRGPNRRFVWLSGTWKGHVAATAPRATTRTPFQAFLGKPRLNLNPSILSIGLISFPVERFRGGTSKFAALAQLNSEREAEEELRRGSGTRRPES